LNIEITVLPDHFQLLPNKPIAPLLQTS
jgi:hypothetical protein